MSGAACLGTKKTVLALKNRVSIYYSTDNLLQVMCVISPALAQEKSALSNISPNQLSPAPTLHQAVTRQAGGGWLVLYPAYLVGGQALSLF